MKKTLSMHLRAVMEALDAVEVRGRDNMEKLLGSIQYLEKIANGEFGDFSGNNSAEE